MIHLIAAMTAERVIGKGNDLPWHIGEDLKRFKKLTDGQTVIMGKRTYESIGRPLPNRNNVVLDKEGQQIEGVDVCKSIPEALSKAKSYDKEIFIIGGASVYEQMLPLAEVMHLSLIKEDYTGDVLFPEYDLADWRETKREEFDEFTAVTYERVKHEQRA